MPIIIHDYSMVVNMADTYVSELLCFTQNYFGKVPRVMLISTVSNFYDDCEVLEAKNTLFSIVGHMKLSFDDIPRKVNRKGDNKRKMDAEDIVALMEFLDAKKVELPDFLAKKLHRVPTIPPADVDVYKLSETVNAVKTQLQDIQAVVASVVTNQAQLTSSVNIIASMPAASSHVSTETVNAEAWGSHDGPSRDAATSNVTLADMFSDTSGKAEWFKVQKQQRPQPRIRKIVGGRSADGVKLKAIPSDWHIFVGRMDPSTSAEEMTEMLKSNNINVVDCKLLRKTAEWQERFAAFRVVVSAADKDRVFDESVWPEGADVRDWRFKL